ncbi:UDP-N-acetylmuramoyl-tripeptide--D-alanyl-D-alanine ligase [Paenibacillus sp. MZ04-78.2]|uniref:UDP-N-acetylmuramoyl-tripeptide--D-alanyl-D- alanine ligase n=1 Tax=Paenibacillus sp. MZ04-78.2 TaxID=2962034 RepID=UPI0020B65548|nr:UDP-N-acetylmuramoyl-tripeptide--D-alanyl-D-alanine ligase [Paenibacillus sp. MZ04-78.2]MCP3774388.1 UDP-N-acetylmuramoyl-tripeptide--D-alanyl-D-alanine ligase [Paenibacillus sp. MZ04-78.2]
MRKKSILYKPIIAVTGSSGKTTTKEMIAAVLKKRWQIFKSPQNRNAVSATKRHAKLLRSVHRAAVLEYGMQYYGNIKRHCHYIRPNIGVITHIGRAHIGNFGGRIQGVAKAKSELIRYMKPTGTLWLNADDQHSKLLRTKGFKGRIVRIGIRNKAVYRASKIHTAKRGMTFRVKLDGKEHRFYIPILGRHNIFNALFAIGISHRLGFTPKQIQSGLKTYEKPKRRLYVYDLRRGIRLIDDSYSANPDAVKAALDVLAATGQKKKIAVLGSMLELGAYSVYGHKEIGRYAARKNITHVYAIGKHASQIIAGARAAGFPAQNLHSFGSRAQLRKALTRAIQPGTTILVKGSNQMGLNKIVAYLRQTDFKSR